MLIIILETISFFPAVNSMSSHLTKKILSDVVARRCKQFTRRIKIQESFTGKKSWVNLQQLVMSFLF